eukprot:s247_g31.t1
MRGWSIEDFGKRPSSLSALQHLCGNACNAGRKKMQKAYLDLFGWNFDVRCCILHMLQLGHYSTQHVCLVMIPYNMSASSGFKALRRSTLSFFIAAMVSHLHLCQRTLVSALLAVAAVLSVEPSVNRDSDPPCLRAAYGTILEHGAAPMVSL